MQIVRVRVGGKGKERQVEERVGRECMGKKRIGLERAKGVESQFII